MAEGTTLQNSANETFGKLLARNAANHGSDIVVREKERGIWRESTGPTTWTRFWPARPVSKWSA